MTFAAAAVTAVVAFATVTTITNPDTPAAVAALEQTAGPHDVVAAYPSEYLLVLYYGDNAIDLRTRSMASDVPWFWGTAVYPSGAVLQSMPMAVADRAIPSGTSSNRAIRRRRIPMATRLAAPAAGLACVSPC